MSANKRILLLFLALLTVVLSGCFLLEGNDEPMMQPIDESLVVDEPPEESVMDDLTDIVVLGEESVAVERCPRGDADCQRCRDNAVYTRECIGGTCQGPVDLVKRCDEDERCVVGESEAYCELVLEAFPELPCRYCRLNDNGDLVVETLDIQDENFPKDVFKQVIQDGFTYWVVDEANPHNRVLDEQTVMAKGIPLASIKNPGEVLSNPNPSLQGDYSAFTNIPYRTLDSPRETGEYEGREDVVLTLDEWNRLFS